MEHSQSTPPPSIDRSKQESITIRAARRTFVAAGLYALACIPAIFICESLGWREAFLHLSQFIAVLTCLPGGCLFLWATRGTRFDFHRGLAAVASIFCGVWLVWLVYVVLSLDFSTLDKP
jgi:hypothetical protein